LGTQNEKTKEVNTEQDSTRKDVLRAATDFFIQWSKVRSARSFMTNGDSNRPL